MPKIILSESHDAKSFETGSIIHEGEFKKAKSWIDNQLKEAEDAMKKTRLFSGGPSQDHHDPWW